MPLSLAYLPSSTCHSLRVNFQVNGKKRELSLCINKSGDQENVDNYRPISVLNCHSKISERLVFNTSYAFLVKENLLYKLQSGFRHHHSTATALIQFIDTVYNDFDNHNITGALFLDLRKAFDTVHHKILLDKFKWFNPSEKLLAWMSSYLAKRSKVVDFNGTLSMKVTLTAGVPQGSILGPLLFLMYVIDLPSVTKGETIIMFADDSTCLSHGNSIEAVSAGVEHDLNSLCEYARKNHLVDSSR